MSALCLHVFGLIFGNPLSKLSPACRGVSKNLQGGDKKFGLLRSPPRTPLTKTQKPPLFLFVTIVLCQIVKAFSTNTFNWIEHKGMNLDHNFMCCWKKRSYRKWRDWSDNTIFLKIVMKFCYTIIYFQKYFIILKA